jgi:hypothetical protein
MNTCRKCQQQFKSKVKINGKYHTLHKRRYCLDCLPLQKAYPRRPKIETNCITCGKPTFNPKFCSRSCHITYQNSNKHLKEYFCKHCGKSTGFGWQSPTTCKDCNGNSVDWSQITLDQFTHKHRLNCYQKHARIRSLARTVMINMLKFVTSKI